MQIDDLNAINTFFRSANAITPAAFNIAFNWKPWFDGLSWFQKNTDSATLKEAQSRRDQFNKANIAKPKVVQDATGKTTTMPAAQKLTIKEGSRGANVVEWQQLIGISPADGIFGPNTTKLSKAWQARNGLTADGIIGPASWGKALSSGTVFKTVATAQAKQADAIAAVKPAGAKVPVGTPIAANAGSVLRRGSQGQVVADWQKKIGIKATGIFDEATERATKDWQVKHGLNGDGIVGPATKAASLMVASAPGPTPTVRLVEAVKQSPAKVVETIKATPKKVTATITKTAGAVTPKGWPVWAQVVGAAMLGAFGIAGINSIRKK